MSWVISSLLCGFFLAATDAVSKVAVRTSSEYLIAWVRFFYAVPFLIIFLPFIEIPNLDPTFFFVSFLLIPLEITALILYVKAIKISLLSVTIPFLGLTPVFLIITSFIILGETPDMNGLFGVLFVAAGAYLLNVTSVENGILEPFFAIWKEKGSRLMILVAFIYSITSNLGKICIEHSSPIFFAVFYIMLLTIFFFPFNILKNHIKLTDIFSRLYIFSAIGFFSALVFIFHNLALDQTSVAYMIALKRTNMIFSVIIGAVFFNEIAFKHRLLGSIIMLCGVTLISI